MRPAESFIRGSRIKGGKASMGLVGCWDVEREREGYGLDNYISEREIVQGVIDKSPALADACNQWVFSGHFALSTA
jgi:hypothetical protein